MTAEGAFGGHDSSDGHVYVLEVNPRASRTVPFLSKVTGVPMVALATRIALGESLAQLGYGGLPNGLWPEPPLVAVKGPVFSMAKITGGEMALSPEMKSTGEVLGVDRSYSASLTKALLAAHIEIPVQDGVAFVSLADRDKPESLPILRRLSRSRLLLLRHAGHGGVPGRRRHSLRPGEPYSQRRRYDSAAHTGASGTAGAEHADRGRRPTAGGKRDARRIRDSPQRS